MALTPGAESPTLRSLLPKRYAGWYRRTHEGSENPNTDAHHPAVC